MHKYKNLSMRCIFPYLFICYLATLIPIIEFAQREGNQINPKTLLYKYMYLFILLFSPYTNFRALHHLTVLSTRARTVHSSRSDGSRPCNSSGSFPMRLLDSPCFGPDGPRVRRWSSSLQRTCISPSVRDPVGEDRS
jgi:hypothetical protein